MDRRTCLAALAGGILAAVWDDRAATAREPTVDKEVLRDQLIRGLRVTTDEQRQYIDRVVTLVEKKKLTAAEVYAMFRWARNRDRRYPFIYFRRGLDTLAARRGIKI